MFCSILSFVSMPLFAETDPVNFLVIYDKNKDVQLFVDLDIEHIQAGSSFGGRKENMKTDCSIQLGNPSYSIKDGDSDFSMKEDVDSYMDYKINVISKKDNAYTIILELNLNETNSVSPSIKLTDSCSVANDVITTTTVRWAGTVQVGKPVNIKMPKDNELIMEVNKELPEDYFSL